MRVDSLPREELLARIADFHGHLGPYVIMGFRAGCAVRRLLGARGYFDLEAMVQSGDRPPISCFADGVQLGSGCTTGKGNLKVAWGSDDGTGVQARTSAVFTTRPADGEPARRVVVRVLSSAEEQASRWMRDLGEREAAERVLDLDERSLFEIGAVAQLSVPESMQVSAGRVSGMGAVGKCDVPGRMGGAGRGA